MSYCARVQVQSRTNSIVLSRFLMFENS